MIAPANGAVPANSNSISAITAAISARPQPNSWIKGNTRMPARLIAAEEQTVVRKVIATMNQP
jgi:hypothetical protein